MKLQDATKKIIEEEGISILEEKRLVFLLADYLAFDDFPAVKPVMRSIVLDGYGKELCRLGSGGNRNDYLGYAGSLKEALARDRHFRRELADYAVDCITYALGLIGSVKEPDNHGFDAEEGKSWQKNTRVRLLLVLLYVLEPAGGSSAAGDGPLRRARKLLMQILVSLVPVALAVLLLYPLVKYPFLASHLGLSEALYEAGSAYASGDGVDRNPEEAVRLWKKAAEKGNTSAKTDLGYASAAGDGTEQDYAAAVRWWLGAAKDGVPEQKDFKFTVPEGVAVDDQRGK